MAQPAVSKKEVIVVFAGKRVLHTSTLSFDEVLCKLRSSMGKTRQTDVLDPSRSLEWILKKRVKQHEGESGFMLFVEMDHGSWMEKFGVKRRVVRWIFGNPLVAITMLRHDYTAGPVCAAGSTSGASIDGNNGTGCNITYVLPSSA